MMFTRLGGVVGQGRWAAEEHYSQRGGSSGSTMSKLKIIKRNSQCTFDPKREFK